MKHRNPVPAVLACLLLWACSPAPRVAAAAERAPATLEGAWRATRVDVDYGRDIGTHTVDVQPAIYVFSRSHFAITAVDGFEARAFLSEKPTDEELGRAFTPFSGATGTYVSTPDKLTLTAQVTKNPADMVAPAPADYELQWVDERVWLVTTTPDDARVRTELTRLTDDTLKVSPDAEKLRGVWRRAEMIVGAREDSGRHVDDMQPGYYIFAPPYFAGTFVSAFAPRPPPGEKASEADLGRAFAPFASFAGAYSLMDNTLVFHPLVTMNPNNMRGRPFQSIRTQWAGEDIWLIYTGVDGAQNRVRLTRVAD